MSESFQAEELLSDDRWVRELARSLTIDRSAADDLVQETWLATLRSAPRQPIFSPRAWFRRVLLTAAGHDARRNALRAEREFGAARPEALPSTAELAERAELHRTLAGAVLALSEPYRSTILWRYFGDLSSEEIARRLGVSPSTVRNRLRRGLDLLRSTLERRGASNWRTQCLALAAVKSGPGDAGVASNWIHQGVIVGTKAKLAIAAGVALAVSAVLWIEFGQRESVAQSETRREVSEVTEVPASSATAELDSASQARAEIPHTEEVAQVTAIEQVVETPSALQELEVLRDRLRPQIEASMLGQIDPSLYLDLALRLSALDPGKVLLEPGLGGSIRFPLEGTPEGMHAELQIRKTTNSNWDSRVDTISITLDNPSEPYVVDGLQRTSARADMTLWRDHEGKVAYFGILTVLETKQVAWGSATSALFSYDVKDPHASPGSVGGMLGGPTSGSPGDISDIPISIVGGKWPNDDLLNQFNANMKTLYGKLNQ